MSREYLILLPLGRMPVGTLYARNERLPLHCTVVHFFTLGPNLTPTTLSGVVDSIVTTMGVHSIELVSHAPARFGPKNDVPVHVLRQNNVLDLLHTRLLVALSQKGCKFTKLQYVGAGYTPHVTPVDAYAFLPTMRFHAHFLVIIEYGEDRDRVVLSEHHFSQ